MTVIEQKQRKCTKVTKIIKDANYLIGNLL